MDLVHSFATLSWNSLESQIPVCTEGMCVDFEQKLLSDPPPGPARSVTQFEDPIGLRTTSGSL